ncbi:EAL domain-containing protein [Marichromatium bheemlicum]|uniref:EAL domain-containing protein n=1 Tax=Marichromatium bheemlicum TaxID=365339 RepID=A0ABX1I4S7_9GAMM|nr:EAL domain-containing protein [Marichromatium bheemlicum]NKN32570.1 EAL domain-containing protein [Marichromatium bheemlicum]
MNQRSRPPDSAPSLDQGFAIELIAQWVEPAFVLDASGQVVVWNVACERLTGVAATAVVGTREHWRAFFDSPQPCPADFLVQGRREELGDHYTPSATTGVDIAAEAVRVEGWCEMPQRADACYLGRTVGPIRDAEGQLVAVVETLRDLSEQQRALQALQRSASVFHHAQEGIVITDAGARILDVNAAFTRVTGYPREEALGHTPALLKSGLQDDSYYQEMWYRLREFGQWSGEIWNRRKSGEVYPEMLRINAVKDADGVLTHYVGMFSDITDLKEAQRRLESLANYDALTSLPNRVLLSDRLHQALANAKRRDRLVAICFLDLDDFKLVNDRHGHDAGDRFLIEIAKRLVRTVRGGDTVARLGGDEFVLLITELRTTEELDRVLERALQAIDVPFEVDDAVLDVSASVGVTLYPLDDVDPDTLLRHADQAMYQAKQLGRNRYQLFDLEAAAKIEHHHQELERMRCALQHGELRLFYQPKVNMRTGEVIGVEALIRWQHPERGILAPDEFLPLLERSPLIIDIGEWVLHEALAQLVAWSQQGHPLSVSVNIATRHFQHIDFVARLQAILAEYPGVAPERLEIEILESVALGDVEAMRAVITACQALGVRFALDDFGTGYSSLNYLKQLPAETLKIDRSFVRDMLEDQEDLAIIEGVIGLATVFGKEVIAEGVETPEHGVMLMRIGCDYAQGYAIARPMPAEAVHDWLEGFEPDPRWLLGRREQDERFDLPLLLAQYDHVKWVRQVIGALDAGEGAAAVLDDQTEQCRRRFATWLAGAGRKRYGALAEYAEIERLQARMYEISAEIVRLRANGQWEAARLQCMELIGMKRQVLAKLDGFQRTPVKGEQGEQG